jgi:formylglycine-generating enzyme required for sulfatase activity
MGVGFQAFLSGQSEIYKKMNWSTEFPQIEAKRLPYVQTRSQRPISGEMVKIPEFRGSMEVVFRVREVGFYDSIDSRFVNIGALGLHYETSFSIEANFPSFLIDETPVTNRQFHQFLNETGYSPAEKLNFLKHWTTGGIPEGKDDCPVVYVSLEDSPAYAAWAGKRLPTELEWQFAGQGFEKNKYPWGNEMSAGRCNNGETGELTAVKAHPNGKSVFGCVDMCGNAWEMTESEHSDGRNRFCILKGGSFYKAHGSEWYFDGGAQPLNFSAKQLLIYPGIDRCSTVGFRCAADI